jgi:hypothetical protein
MLLRILKREKNLLTMEIYLNMLELIHLYMNAVRKNALGAKFLSEEDCIKNNIKTEDIIYCL